MIPRDTISLIVESARIEDVVGEFVNLKRRGANLMGRCPFHDERTPSFTVSPAKGIYKCFGCGKAGDSVRFIMEHEQLSYPDALRFLARKYGIEVKEAEVNPEQLEAEKEKEALFVVNQFALGYFSRLLTEDEEGIMAGLSYFKERGFTEDTIRKFELGYSSEVRDKLTKTALEKGFKQEYLIKLGLTKQTEEGNTYDYFRGRVMFPIHNASGRVIGFGGRVLRKNDKTAKYLNSPESEIYHKSKTLYGIHLARKEMVSKDLCYLVEGYTDVISLHQAGIENVVASSGTSLTTEQIRMIKRFTLNVTILYDGDFAGIKASFRGIDMILEQGMNVRVLLFPDGEDPDSFSQKTERHELLGYLNENAKDFISFKAEILSKEAANDPVKKAGVIRDIVSSIALIPDGITRSVYVKSCSRIMDMEESTLLNALNQIRRDTLRKNIESRGEYGELPAPPPVETAKTEAPATTSTLVEEQDLIRFMIQYGNKELVYPARNSTDDILLDEYGHEIHVQERVCDFIIHDLTEDGYEFESQLMSRIFKEFREVWSGDDAHQVEDWERHFLYHPDDEIRGKIFDLINTGHHLSENWIEKRKVHTPHESHNLFRSLIKVVHTLKSKRVTQILDSRRKQLAEAKSDEEIQRLMAELLFWEEVKKKFSQELGRVIHQ